MENNQLTSIESFSYSWLLNQRSPLELDWSPCSSPDLSDEASYIEMDPKMTPEMRCFSNSDFKFDFHVSQYLRNVAYADKLFQDGYVMPGDLSSCLGSSKVSESQKHCPAPEGKARCSSFRKCYMFSKEMLLKYLNVLRPLLSRIQSQKFKKKENSKVWMKSAAASPIRNERFSADGRSSLDSDGTIYDAVLHCKRSIGMRAS